MPSGDLSSSEFYDRSFYDRQRDRSAHSAARILPLVFRLFPVTTLADFGCGVGTWLAAGLELGATDALGVDGPWVRQTDIQDSRIGFRPQDLEERIRVSRRYDLAVSLEVAEHLDPDRAKSFVEDLTLASNRVLFSAAVPGQGGDHHVNEQWQSYWAGLFGSFDYRPLDVVRPKVWDEASLPSHYKQNTLLYVGKDDYETVAAAARREGAGPPITLDVVHPGNYSRLLGELERPLNLKEGLVVARGLPGSFYRALRRRLPGGNA